MQPRVPTILRGRAGVAFALVVVLAIALWLRLDGVRWGFPALYDPDEPVFEMTALHLFRDQTLNPGWFGHPGSTTIYTLAAINAGVLGWGHLTGVYPDAHALAAAAYLDPGVIFEPGRLFIVFCGVACVALTFVIGRALGGQAVGLLAAALLALDPTHIHYSQIIRTDMHASVFLLGAMAFTVAVARRGRMRDYALAGVFAGLACATKWPAALVIASPLMAGLLRMERDTWRRDARGMLLAVGTMAAATVLASPYLVIDHATVVRNLTGELAPAHLGATGHGWFGNIAWYAANPLAHSVGWLGIALAVVGAMVACRNRAAAAAMAGPVVFVAAIATQQLVWARWIVPVLPAIAILVALGLVWLTGQARRLAGVWPAGLLAAGLLALVMVPMAARGQADAAERHTDTRALATAWLHAHAAPDASVVFEHGGVDLMHSRWTLLFPVGEAGCLDVRKLLGGQIRLTRVDTLRRGSAILDIGAVTMDKIDTCRADYAVLTNYDRYVAERASFPEQMTRYDRLLAGAAVVARFVPVTGEVGGPVVTVARLAARERAGAANAEAPRRVQERS